jgi:hypothetical protein
VDPYPDSDPAPQHCLELSVFVKIFDIYFVTRSFRSGFVNTANPLILYLHIAVLSVYRVCDQQLFVKGCTISFLEFTA